MFFYPGGSIVEGLPLLTGKRVGLEKRMGERGTQTSNRREERAF